MELKLEAPNGHISGGHLNDAVRKEIAPRAPLHQHQVEVREQRHVRGPSADPQTGAHVRGERPAHRRAEPGDCQLIPAERREGIGTYRSLLQII